MIKFITNFELILNTIFLLGYMGCGKSILGKALASQKNISFIDLDKKIEEHEKLCRIMQKQTHDKIHKLEGQINRIESILLVSTGALITGMGYVIFTLVLK